jgi:hypothetical protein
MIINNIKIYFLTTSGCINAPSITTELFASHRAGWIVHSIGVPVKKVIGRVIRPRKNNLSLLLVNK